MQKYRLSFRDLQKRYIIILQSYNRFIITGNE